MDKVQHDVDSGQPENYFRAEQGVGLWNSIHKDSGWDNKLANHRSVNFPYALLKHNRVDEYGLILLGGTIPLDSPCQPTKGWL